MGGGEGNREEGEGEEREEGEGREEKERKGRKERQSEGHREGREGKRGRSEGKDYGEGGIGRCRAIMLHVWVGGWVGGGEFAQRVLWR